MTGPRRETTGPRRALTVVRLLWGGLLVAAPRTVLTRLGGTDQTAGRGVARVLGARHLSQGLAELTAHPRLRRLGVTVDAAHACSAGVLAVLDRRWRRPAFADAAVAGAFAVAGTITRP